MDREMIESLREISTFNISARYDDYKNSFYVKATESYAKQYLKVIGDIRKWLKKQILTK